MRKRILVVLMALLVAISFSAATAIRAAAEKKEKQPHMEAALAHLRAAQKELGAASHDKGGHLTNAENYTIKAIEEVEAGIKYADEHRK